MIISFYNLFVMNFVFFDIECANCIRGEGKRCSFGYVKTDENFNVLQKQDLVMNPEAPFLLGDAKSGRGIRLAYPTSRFLCSPYFPHFYKQIRKLLTAPDTYSFGFDVNQDASFLSYTCGRYHVPYIDFKFFDIQAYEKEINHRKNASGLESLVKEYNVQSFTYHRSDDDARRTREVFKAMIEKEKKTVIEVWNEHRECIDDTENLVKRIRAHKKQKEIRRLNQKKKQDFFGLPRAEKNINCYKSLFWGKKFYFPNRILSDPRFRTPLLKVRDAFFKSGGELITTAEEADYIVTIDYSDSKRVMSKYPKANPIIFEAVVNNLNK